MSSLFQISTPAVCQLEAGCHAELCIFVLYQRKMENTTIASTRELLLSTTLTTGITTSNDGSQSLIDDPYNVSPGFSTLVFDACTGIMIITGIFGIIANFGIITLFMICPHIRTPFNYLLMNMILAETIIACFGIPVDALAAWQHGWKSGKELCEATGFILTTTGEVSIITLAFLSIHRLMTVRGAPGWKIHTFRKSFSIIISIWVYTFFITIPPFFGFGTYVVEASGLSCTPDFTSDEHTVFVIYWFLIGFVIPLSCIIVSSVMTLRHLHKQNEDLVSTAVKKLSEKRERRVGILILCMNLSFLICWMPYAIVCMCYIFGGKGFVDPAVVVVPLITAKFSICSNPILYAVMNPQFRNAFRNFNTDPSIVSKTTRLSSPPRRRVEIMSPSHTSSRIRGAERVLKKQPSTLNVLPSLEAMNKQRTLSFDANAINLAEISIRRVMTVENLKNLESMKDSLTQELYLFTKTETGGGSKNSSRKFRVSFAGDDPIESSSDESDCRIQFSDQQINYQPPMLLVPSRPLSILAAEMNWICFDPSNFHQKIVQEDKELFGIDWKILEFGGAVERRTTQRRRPNI